MKSNALKRKLQLSFYLFDKIQDFLRAFVFIIQFSVSVVYNVCGGMFVNSCIPYSLSTLRDFVKILFNKPFIFTSLELSWEYDICSNLILLRRKSSSEMMYSEQLKYIRLVKNITSWSSIGFIFVYLRLYLFLSILYLYGFCFFPSFIGFLKKY